MFSAYLTSEVQDFINKNTDNKISDIAFQKNPFPNLDWTFILNQIEVKGKCKSKLPTWFETKNIIFPSKLSYEQSSSEITAAYKSELVSGNTLIDMTGGWGVDDYFFSKKIKKIIHCELNESLSSIVTHNMKNLGVTNIQTVTGDSLAYCQSQKLKVDWMYIDPSRRNDSKGKVFLLEDCLPNVPELLPEYFEFTDNILIKTAPILDIQAGIKSLKNVVEIHIVSVNNEVKELLWLIQKKHTIGIKIKCIDFGKTIQSFNFDIEALPGLINYSEPLTYLYEPNASIMKSGGYNLLAYEKKISKLHPHSHLFTSDEIIPFEGRSFKIMEFFVYNKKEMKRYLDGKKANITTRNFPESVDLLRKKWNIKDGSNTYVFFTTALNNDKIVLICTKI